MQTNLFNNDTGKIVTIKKKIEREINFHTLNKHQNKIGNWGENHIREKMISKGYNFIQPDLLFKYNEKWFLAEIKTCELYLSPPFDGHGLKYSQLKTRIHFKKNTGIETVLFINCLTTNKVYWNYTSELMKTDYFITEKSQMIVFNINDFNVWD